MTKVRSNFRSLKLKFRNSKTFCDHRRHKKLRQVEVEPQLLWNVFHFPVKHTFGARTVAAQCAQFIISPPITSNTTLIKRFIFLFIAFLSAAEIPQSDVQKSEDVATTLANLQAASNEAVSNETTKAPETSKAADNENASVEGGSSTDTMPPLVFPADEEKTSTKNETLLKILQSSSNAASTEVIDLSRFPVNSEYFYFNVPSGL